MGPDTIWVLIPLTAIVCGIGAKLARRWMDLKERQLAGLNSETAEKAAQYAAKTERLEQRVAVLERILTDRGTHLAEEIERLRDRPLN
jgi:hypothetical protein